MQMSNTDYQYVQSFISNISFPNDIEGLRYFVYEHGKYNIEDILQDFLLPQIWTVPRHSKKGDIILFYHAKTAEYKAKCLKRDILANEAEIADSDKLLQWLNRALDLYKIYGGKIFALGQVNSLPSAEDGSPFEGQHWRGRIYAEIKGIHVLGNPIDISEFNEQILISRQSAITYLPNEQFDYLRNIIMSKNTQLPNYYQTCRIGDFALASLTNDNYMVVTKEYRRRFLLEIDFRTYYVDFLLKTTSNKRFYRECACQKDGVPTSFVDNVFQLDGKYYLLEVKLNIHIEHDLIGQLQKYITSDFLWLDNKRTKKLENFERDYMYVIDTEAIYRYTPKDNQIVEIIRLDELYTAEGFLWK